MVNAANAMGLKEIAITDHGYYHLCHTTKEKIVKARKLIDEINTWSNTKVLLGIEANIISEDGTLDIDNETISMLDVLIVGYHRFIKTDFADIFGNSKDIDARKKATNAFLNAIEKYPITLISHPNCYLDLDLYKIGCMCRDYGVLIELNNRHPNFTDEQMADLLASDCMFVVSSDAHTRSEVGKTDKAFELIRKYNIPSHNIVNVEFELSEMSDEDKEIKDDWDMVTRNQRELEEEEKNDELLRKYEFVDELSPEIEEKLEKIAEEKNILYHRKENKVKRTKVFKDNGAQVSDLIAKAEEYLKSRPTNEASDDEDFEESETVRKNSRSRSSKQGNAESSEEIVTNGDDAAGNENGEELGDIVISEESAEEFEKENLSQNGQGEKNSVEKPEYSEKTAKPEKSESSAKPAEKRKKNFSKIETIVEVSNQAREERKNQRKQAAAQTTSDKKE